MTSRHRRRDARPAALLAALLTPGPSWGAAPAPEDETETELRPVPVASLRGRAPAPQLDVGLVLGACGVGQPFWSGTDFCGAVVADAVWGRNRSRDLGWGGYVQAGTSGFFDFRASVGPELVVPLGELFVLQGRAGPLLLSYAEGAAPGGAGFIELGMRGLSLSSHYSMTHTLCLGIEHTIGDGSRAGTALWLGLRLDAFWLALPVRALTR